MAWSVAQRTHEIGIRMALGAGRRDSLRMVVIRGVQMVTAGMILGLAGAFAATGVFGSLLYNVQPDDPPTLAAVGLVLAISALVACYLPARRATRTDPAAALRHE
jgi:putative ABC transport system permease protein